MHDLIADGNSIVLVDHDTEILRDADWLIEMGPGAGENGGTILTQGTVEQVAQSPASRIGPFLADLHTLSARTRTSEAELFALGSHHPAHPGHPHRQAAGSPAAQGAAHCGDRRVRFRQDHAGAGKPDPRAGGRRQGRSFARPCGKHHCTGHCAGQAH